MDKTITNNLCKGLRACGIQKEMCHTILNVISKWYDESGAEWTCKRIKDLRQWYETCLAGKPTPPEWFRHGKDDYPLGIWKEVFKLPVAKALGVLSCSTVFYEKHLSETQKKKFLRGVQGNNQTNLDSLTKMISETPRSVRDWNWKKPKKMKEIQSPTIFDMNGSVPVHDGQSTVRAEQSLHSALKALEESWRSVPQVTFDFLDQQNLLGIMPVGVLGNEYALELNKPHSSVVGRISVIQEPELKARVVANPNRVMQVTLDPLKLLVMKLVKDNPNDCIFDQEGGMTWVQSKLRDGITLAGSDLTSASDLLSFEGCCLLLNHFYNLTDVEGFLDHIVYYHNVCRSKWYCPELQCEIQWQQGDPLGTGPSIGILSEANACACYIALAAAQRDGLLLGLKASDSFRVLGDDVIMYAEMEPYYEKVILALGGEINHTKTLTSNKVAEFAGRIIDPTHVYLKKIKYSEPSDASFMDYMSSLGDQAKYILKPKQRKAYDFYKYVPGFIVPGPWIRDSYGVPFLDRYLWYLDEVLPVLDREETDRPESEYWNELNKAMLSQIEAYQREWHVTYDDPSLSDREILAKMIETTDYATPTIDEGYLPSRVTPSFRSGGDPRLTHGKTTLERLTNAMSDITPFTKYQSTIPRPSSSPGEEESRTEPDSFSNRDDDDYDLDDI